MIYIGLKTTNADKSQTASSPTILALVGLGIILIPLYMHSCSQQINVHNNAFSSSSIKKPHEMSCFLSRMKESVWAESLMYPSIIVIKSLKITTHLYNLSVIKIRHWRLARSLKIHRYAKQLLYHCV